MHRTIISVGNRDQHSSPRVLGPGDFFVSRPSAAVFQGGLYLVGSADPSTQNWELGRTVVDIAIHRGGRFGGLRRSSSIAFWASGSPLSKAEYNRSLSEDSAFPTACFCSWDKA